MYALSLFISDVNRSCTALKMSSSSSPNDLPSADTQSTKVPDVVNLTALLKDAALNEPVSDHAQPALISTVTALSTAVDALQGLPVVPPSLYVDLEGVYLSRHGSISILQIYVLPTKATYLIDVHTLQDQAFTTAGKNGQTLKHILESATIPKVFFDVRNDSDALYSHFGVSLAGIQDLQLMEFITRPRPGQYLCGLGRCIEYDCELSFTEKTNWKAIKDKGVDLFAPEKGGSYQVFNERPLSSEILSYCISDVEFLPRLWELYKKRLTPSLEQKVIKGAKDRVALSQSPTFNGKGKHMAMGPTTW